MLSIFSCAWWPSVCLLWRNVYLYLLPIFQLGCLFLDIELYELFVCFRSFANIFSHSIDCLFIFSMVSFAVQKLLGSISSYLFIFVFISFALRNGSRKYCYALCQIVFCLFSSRSFMVSNLKFRSLIPF